MCERKSNFSMSRRSFITSNRFLCSADQCSSSVSVTKRTAMTSISISSLHVSPQPKHRSQGSGWIWPSQHKHFCLCCCFSPFVLLFLQGRKREASGEKVGHLTNLKKTLVLCVFVFLCIKHLNFSSSTVSLLFPRRGMHGSEESNPYRDELFSDSISNKYATHLISFLPPSCNPSICARRQISAFHQVNTPISSDNDTGKEGRNLNFEVQCWETVQHKLGENSHFCSWCLIFVFPS